jgi:hypothetical protein
MFTKHQNRRHTPLSYGRRGLTGCKNPQQLQDCTRTSYDQTLRSTISTNSIDRQGESLLLVFICNQQTPPPPAHRMKFYE